MKCPEISTSYKVTSAPPNSSKKRKSTSDVWNHFIKETDQNRMVWAKCQHCGKFFSGLSEKGTTHLRNHLNSLKCKRSQKEKISSSETGGLENPTVTNGKFVFDEERSGLDLTRMIIKNGYLLNMVEHEDFIIFVKNLQPTIKLPSQDTLKDKILRFYREEKEKLRKQFDKVLSLSLILNFWTDYGKKSKYCSFTLQFVEDGPKLKKKIIAIINVGYNYTGETLFEIVKGVVLEWNIGKKLATMTVESSSANDQMVDILRRWLGDQGNCHPIRNDIFHIPCITHAINLLVKDGLDEIDYILHKIRKAIKNMSETTIGKQKFEEVVKKLNLGGKKITSEGVPLRWDSTFFMLQIALEFRQEEAFVDQGSCDCVFFKDLSTEEWDKAEVMHKCLNIFYKGICRFLGSKCLSANVYFSMIFDIYDILLELQESDVVKKMEENFCWFFSDMCLVYAIVAVFDPRTKLDFVKYSMKQYYDDISQNWKLLNADLKYLFNLYDKYLTSQRSSSSFINNDNSSSSDGDDPCNILDEWKKWKRQRTELEKYLQEPLQPDEKFDILGWWHTKSQDYPTLWTMARDILAIPLSNSTSNSAFCIETMTLDPIFNDLDPDVIEAVFCWKDWLDNPIRITPNKDNDHSTANPEPRFEISGSTSGLEPLLTGDTLHVLSGTSAPQEKRDPSNAEIELMLTNGSATSCPRPLPLPTKDSVKLQLWAAVNVTVSVTEQVINSFSDEFRFFDEEEFMNPLPCSEFEELIWVTSMGRHFYRITPNKDNDHSTANPEPMLEISGSTSGLEPLPTGDTSHVWSGTSAPQEKHYPSNADTELILANGSATLCPEPLLLPLPTKEFGLVDEEIMNVFKPYTEMEKIICNYVFNKDLDGSEVLFKMKYDHGDRAAFYTLSPNHWISSQIINLVVCKMMEEKRFSKINAWYLPTHFSQKMIVEDGNPTLEWFEKTYWGDDKYMSRLIYCEQIYIPMNDNNNHWYLCVIDLMTKGCIYIFDSLPSTTRQDIRTKNVKTVVTGLDKLLTYLEKDNYTNSITKFPLKSSTSNLIQNNGYDCGVYVIKHMYTHISNNNLPFLEKWSERFRYKLASNLVLSKENEERSKIKENAGKIPLHDYFRLLK